MKQLLLTCIMSLIVLGTASGSFGAETESYLTDEDVFGPSEPGKGSKPRTEAQQNIFDRFDKTEKELKPLAEQGDAEAQNSLGVIYGLGDGVIQNYAEAVKWYRPDGPATGHALTFTVDHSMGANHAIDCIPYKRTCNYRENDLSVRIALHSHSPSNDDEGVCLVDDCGESWSTSRMSAFGGKADINHRCPKSPLIAKSGH